MLAADRFMFAEILIRFDRNIPPVGAPVKFFFIFRIDRRRLSAIPPLTGKDFAV
jgi:hypothetical protein